MAPLLTDTLTDTAQLSTEHPVDRALVHKRSTENVFITSVSATAADRFRCVGRLPIAHGFFNDGGRIPRHDILFYTELGRQASLAVCHAFLNVSTDDVFIFEGSSAELSAGAWNGRSASADDTVIVEIEAREIVRRKGAVNRVVAEHTMWIGNDRVFRGTGAWTIQPKALFQRLRRTSAAASSPFAGAPQDFDSIRTAFVPRAHGQNVVITPLERDGATGEFVATLIVDPAHPYFFDHPCDHVPGMLLLEGCAQLALAAVADSNPDAAPAIGAYDVNFAQFVECGIPTTLTAHVERGRSGGDVQQAPTVRLSISQQGALCGTTNVALAIPTWS